MVAKVGDAMRQICGVHATTGDISIRGSYQRAERSLAQFKKYLCRKGKSHKNCSDRVWSRPIARTG